LDKDSEEAYLSIEWKFDKIFSFQSINIFDKNSNKKFEIEEQVAIVKDFLSALQEYSLFAALKVNEKAQKIELKKFNANINDESEVIYKFLFPVKIENGTGRNSIDLQFIDPTGYMALIGEGKIEVPENIKIIKNEFYKHKCKFHLLF